MVLSRALKDIMIRQGYVNGGIGIRAELLLAP